MKWSDGEPFTTEDVRFWYDDVQMNKELTPAHSSLLSPGGEFVKLEILDETRFKLTFAVPYPPIMNLFAVGSFEPYMPRHYLEQYHATYNPDVAALAKKEGFDNWYELFQLHSRWNFGQQQEDVNLPTIYPWMLSNADATGTKYFERNPYYWKVDTAGNQLPYVDRQIKIVTENPEVFGLKSMAGELSAAGQWLTIRDFPVYKQGEAKGGYRVMLWPSSYGSNVRYTFNLSSEDPVKNKVFNDIRFRQAASLAINRQEINDTFFFGRAVPRQATATPDTSFYEAWMGDHYAEYDPAKAKSLLDEMGMKVDPATGFRRAPDGSPFSFEISVVAGEQRDKVSELVQRYWQAIGLKAEYRQLERSLQVERRNANKLDCTPWDQSNASEFGMFSDTTRMSPSGAEGATRGWLEWKNSGGASGVEPSAEAKKVYELMDQWQSTLPGTPEYERLGKEFLTISVRNLWHIGTVGLSPWPVIIKANLANVPTDSVWGWEYRRFMPYAGDQWYYAQ
jgi:peptide/nickel transport system substrate-binding protein